MSIYSPLFKKISSGNFITFQASAEDLNIFGDNPSKRFRFKNFALLDVPVVQTAVNNENTFQFKNVEGQFYEGLSIASPPPEADRVDFSESLQNYLFNMESILINDPAYNRNIMQNASERLFFKWLKEYGAIRYRVANGAEVAPTILNKFTEEDNNALPINGDIYNKVVKYIGEIDLTGSNYSSYRNGFKEVYIYIPSQNGYTPTVLFKTLSDSNYYTSKVIKQADNVNIEWIQGQDGTPSITPAGLRVSAFYDMDVPLIAGGYDVNGSILNPIWFDSLKAFGPNAYFTDPSFTDPSNDDIIRDPSGTPHTYKRSRLDGVMIDWDKSSYNDLYNSSTIKTFNQYNASLSSGSFKFNVILLYYEVYDPNDETISATNLYGVCFLNDFVTVGSGTSKIEDYDKIKQDKVINTQGSSYGFRLNFRPDVTGDSVQVEIEVSVNDYNTFSMQLFSGAMQQMIDLNTRYEEVIQQNLSLQQQNQALLDMVNNSTTNEDLQNQVTQVNERIDNLITGDPQLALIQQMQQKLDDILQGQTTVGLDFVLDLVALDDLKLFLDSNILTFRNMRQVFNSIEETTFFTDIDNQLKNNIYEIGSFHKLIYHTNGGTTKTCNDNILIYLKDGQTGWKRGQAITIQIEDEIVFGSYGIIIYTDSENKATNANPYEVVARVIPSSEVKRTFMLVCIDPDNFKFLIL